MKPTFQFSADTGRASFSTTNPSSRSLQTDCNFQSGHFSGRSDGKFIPPFRRISGDYFAREARTHYAMEAAVFGLIVLTAAIPVFESIRGLFRLVYVGL